MVQIQSTWFPLVAATRKKYMANYKLGTDADFQKATGTRLSLGGQSVADCVAGMEK